ncbi:MAG TPA: hypothetical protein VFK87_11255, partial [Steroidobacteraceae bacterium]|nr:hypothetical protein [Steroidobacteraceae bacterium]
MHAPPTPPTAVLVVFCRRPSLGAGKQRLAARLGGAGALAVAGALLECALEDAAAWPGELVLSPESPASAHWARQLLARPVRAGGTLGREHQLAGPRRGILERALEQRTGHGECPGPAEQIGGSSDPKVGAHSPAHAAASVRAPILLLHCADDTVVPPSQA